MNENKSSDASKHRADIRFANTLARGLNILRAFQPNDDGLGNFEISKRTGIPKSTVSRLTFTLCALGYLTHGKRHQKYRLGPAALALGNIAILSFSFIEAATPIMQKLANETKTMVGVAIQDDAEMLIVKSWRPENYRFVWVDPGFRMPILKSAVGAAYLGTMNDSELEQIISRLDGDSDDNASACAALREETRLELMTKGYIYLPRKRRFSPTINAMAAPYRPSEFADPVGIFSGATREVLDDKRVADEVGPALAKAVHDLRRVTGRDH